MKKQVLIFLFSCVTISFYAQDTIRFKTNEARAVKVSEIGIDDVKYHRFDNLDGPQYIANKSEITYVRYQNGHIDTFKVAAKPVESATANMASSISSAPLISFRGRKLVYGGRGLGDSKLYRLINNYQYPRTKSVLLTEYKTYKAYKRNQYISGFVGLGIGIGAPYIGFIATVLNSDPVNGTSDPAPFIAGLAIGATVGITGAVVSSVFKHKRNAQKLKIAKLYNEMK